MASLLKEEKAVIGKLIEAHVLFKSLPRQHPAEMEEWVLNFHRLQHLVLIRPTIRSEGWVKDG